MRNRSGRVASAAEVVALRSKYLMLLVGGYVCAADGGGPLTSSMIGRSLWFMICSGRMFRICRDEDLDVVK